MFLACEGGRSMIELPVLSKNSLRLAYAISFTAFVVLYRYVADFEARHLIFPAFRI